MAFLTTQARVLAACYTFYVRNPHKITLVPKAYYSFLLQTGSYAYAKVLTSSNFIR